METNLKNSLADLQAEESLEDIIGSFHAVNVQTEIRNEVGIPNQDNTTPNLVHESNMEEKPLKLTIPSPSSAGSALAPKQVDSTSDSVSLSPLNPGLDQAEKSISSFPKVLSSKELIKLDPVDLAKKLFDESLDGFSRAMVCPIIGKGDEFHQKVLVAYMDCFNFHNISLDEAFRRFCIQLHLTGETQAVDRILFQMSSRYWNCNSDRQNLYRNIDIVYGVLFSIVLLNTDLNTVNIGQKASKKMQVKVFIKNTISLLEGLIEKDPVLSKDLAGVPEAYKTWKKELENTLRDIYCSVRDNPIIQNNPGKVPLATSASKSSSGWGSNANINGGTGGSRFAFLKKAKSVASLFDSPPRESPKSPLAANSIFQIVIEGVLIRKHVLTDDGEKAATRRWTKLWCAMKLSKDQGVELMMHKLSYEDKEYAESEQDTPVQYGETDEYPVISSADVLEKHLLCQANPQRTTLSIGSKYYALDGDFSSSIPSHPILFSPSHEYRLVGNQEPEVFSLIHAFSTSHFHGPQREHCLALHLANNHVYLFHAPTSDASRAWIETINYWASRKSREPLHGSMGNVDFGWAFLSGSSTVSEPLPGSAVDVERLHSIDSASSANATRLDQKRSMKGQKFVQWRDIPLSPRLISNKEENEQLQCMFKQIQFVRKEIEDHEAVKDLMEESLVDHPQYSLVVSNWNRKADALFRELEKYEIYTRSLQSCIIAEQHQEPTDTNMLVQSEKELQKLNPI